MPPIAIIDARVPSEVDKEALAKLEQAQPAAARALRAQAEEFGALLRNELHYLSGGEAPTSVLLLADLAIATMVSVQMQRHMTFGAFGKWTEAQLDDKVRESAEKSQRNLAGISVIARDLLASARAAAREAKADRPRGSASEQLLTALGVEVAAQPPDRPPGAVASGSLPSPFPSSPLEPE